MQPHFLHSSCASCTCAPNSLQTATAAMRLTHVILRGKAVTNLDSMLKSKDITLLIKVHLVKAMDFSDSSGGKESTYNVGDPGLIPASGRSPGEGIGYPLQCSWASLVAWMEKIHLQCGRPGFDTWVAKILWRRERLPTPVSWPGEFHGRVHGVAKSRT